MTCLQHRFRGNVREIQNLSRVVVHNPELKRDILAPMLIIQVFPATQLQYRPEASVRFLNKEYLMNSTSSQEEYRMLACFEFKEGKFITKNFLSDTVTGFDVRPGPMQMDAIVRFLKGTRHWRLINIVGNVEVDTFLFGEHVSRYLYSFEEYCECGIEFLMPVDADVFPPAHWYLHTESSSRSTTSAEEYLRIFKAVLIQGVYRIVYWGDSLSIKQLYFQY